MMNHSHTSRNKAFTLVEIMVVLAIIGILAALLFPAFGRMQEQAAQANCSTNLKQISVAILQYYQDEKAYPQSLTMLMPVSADNPGGAGFINSFDVGKCPDDESDAASRHSYGQYGTSPAASLVPGTPPVDGGQYVWNYWGFNDEGYAYQSASEAAAAQGGGPTYPFLVRKTSAYNHQLAAGYVPSSPKNVVANSMSNRYAGKNTIITHCIYHRIQGSDLNSHTELYYSADPAAGLNAKDIVLFLDGSAKTLDVAEFKNNMQWQNQDF